MRNENVESGNENESAVEWRDEKSDDLDQKRER
jgi:hypothetical protein